MIAHTSCLDGSADDSISGSDTSGLIHYYLHKLQTEIENDFPDTSGFGVYFKT